MKMSLSIREASISFTSACRSPVASLEVSTLSGVGAKRAAIFSSCARSGTASVFCAFNGRPVTPHASTRAKQAVSFIAFSSRAQIAADVGRKPFMIAGDAVAAGGHPEVQFTRVVNSEPTKRCWLRFGEILMRKLLPFFLLVSVAALSVMLKADDEVIEEIVARVNNQIITHSEYLHSKDELKKEAQQQDPVNADKFVAERDKDVLRDLIDQELLLQKGKDLGITADTEVIKKLDEMRKDMKLDSMEDVEKAAQSQGISFEDFKHNMRNQIITQQVIGKEVGSMLLITKEDEQKFYDEHKNDLEQPETIRLSEILVSTDAKPNDASDEAQRVKTAQAKADDLLAQIRKGAKFEDVAKKNSAGPTAAQGGDLGEFKH